MSYGVTAVCAQVRCACVCVRVRACVCECVCVCACVCMCARALRSDASLGELTRADLELTRTDRFRAPRARFRAHSRRSIESRFRTQSRFRAGQVVRGLTLYSRNSGEDDKSNAEFFINRGYEVAGVILDT